MLLFAIITTNQHQPRGYIRSYTRNTIMLLFTVLSIQTFFFELGHENQAEAKVVVAEDGRVVVWGRILLKVDRRRKLWYDDTIKGEENTP